MEVSKTEALNVFEDNLDEIRQACVTNMEDAINKLAKPDIARLTPSEWWVKANVYQLRREAIINQYRPTIRNIDMQKQPHQGQITQLDVERAKEYPLAQLLHTEGRKGNISCPFHDDRKPSFQIKKNNTFTCYSCGAYGDSIELYQKLHQVDFITAVKSLCGSQ